MSERKKIAVCMELFWPFNRHYMINSGIGDYADKYTDWQLDHCNYPEVFIAQGVKYDGIIGRISQGCFDKAEELGIPTVNLWMNSPVRESSQTVSLDQIEAGRIAAEHLVARGFKRIAQVGYKKDYSTKLHWEGVQQVAKENGLSCSLHTVSLNMDESPENWKRFISDIEGFQSEWDAPVGITVLSDETARNVVSILTFLGWRIPQDAAIVGSGKNDLICNSIHPTLSSIALGFHESGYYGAGLLDQMLQGEEVSNQERLVPCRGLVVGESSDVYAVDDPHVAKALEYISNNSNCELSVDHVAKTVGMGRRTLERRFKKLLNRTINDEIVRLRIERLKRLLLETSKPVKSLCSEVGFGTNVHMHNIFKRYTGMTPSQFRIKHKMEK